VEGSWNLCEMDWSEVPQHRIMISETSDGSASSQTTTRLLPAGETRSSLSEPSSTHAKPRPMRCEKALSHQEWCKGRWIFEDVTMALPEFYIVVDVSVTHNYIFSVQLTIQWSSGLWIF
jgi:hypothetical protein